MQAGSSHDGKEFAARYAEAVFTAQQTLGDAQAFYADLKARVERARPSPRRRSRSCPASSRSSAATEAEAQALADELEGSDRARLRARQLADTLEVPVEILELDEPLPEEIPDSDTIEGSQSRSSLIVALARRENLTVRQLLGRLGGGRGHWTFVGTPEQIADAIESWFEAGAADGFNIMGPALPSSLEAFVEHVVPILRTAGSSAPSTRAGRSVSTTASPVPRTGSPPRRLSREQGCRTGRALGHGA